MKRLALPLTRLTTPAWLRRFEFLHQLLLGIAAPFLVLAVTLILAVRFELSGTWRAPALVGFAAACLLTHLVKDPGLRTLLSRSSHTLHYAIAALVAVLAWIWLRYMPEAFDYRQLALAGATGLVATPMQRLFIRQARKTHSGLAEGVRWWGLAAVCAWVIQPYATPYLVGGGDAHHYAQQLSDAAEQLRQGEIKLFVGQSVYAFNGDIHPLRTAPYFSYLGGLASVVLGPTLPATGVQNLLIVISFAAAVAGLYVLLTRLRPTAPWPAFCLTCAFAACPGVLALIYSGDMIISWLSLPWLPLVIYAVVRLWETTDPVPSLCLLAGALAMMWLAHPPMAFWTSALVALSQGTRVIVQWDRGRTFWLLATCAALCLTLCGYVFVSVNSLQLPADPNLVAFVRQGGVLAILREGWSGIGRPIDAGGANLLKNLQLSPALWIAAIVGLAATRRHRWAAGVLIVGAIGMILLLIPWAGVAGRLWSIMPAGIIGATEKWPMQRFYPILSVVVPFLAMLAWPSPATRLTSRLSALLLTILFGATAFSLYDARKFVARGYAVTSSAEMSQRRLRSENVVLSRYSYEYYGRLPRNFTNGTVSPWMQNRLLTRGSLQPIDLNLLALNPASPAAQPPLRTRHRYVATDYGGHYRPPLHLEPKQTYFVRFLFGKEPARGTLQLLGRYIYREYPLPLSGEAQAFGIGPLNRNGFSLWTTAPVADDIEMRFYNQPDQPPPKNLGDVELVSVHQDRLPLQLLSVHPFQIVVRSQTNTWLETPKIFLPGYEAQINGRPAPVERSPDGLLMIPVPAGQHRVHLSYVGPTSLRIAFWFTLGAWLAFFGFWFWRRRWTKPAHTAFFQFGRVATAAAVVGIFALSYPRVQAALFKSEPPQVARSPVAITFTLPVGLERKWETLWTFNHLGTIWKVNCYYENGQNMRVGLARGSTLHAVSEAFQINYLSRHRLIATLTPTGARNMPQLKLWINQKLVLRPTLDVAKPVPEETKTEVAAFHGEILTIAPSDGPID